VAADVAAELRVIWTSHPTKDVRTKAHELYSAIKGFYGDPPMSGREWPAYEDRDHLLGHIRQAEELVEALHTPLA
jgi:hypothetical protein